GNFLAQRPERPAVSAPVPPAPAPAPPPPNNRVVVGGPHSATFRGTCPRPRLRRLLLPAGRQRCLDLHRLARLVVHGDRLMPDLPHRPHPCVRPRPDHPAEMRRQLHPRRVPHPHPRQRTRNRIIRQRMRLSLLHHHLHPPHQLHPPHAYRRAANPPASGSAACPTRPTPAPPPP